MKKVLIVLLLIIVLFLTGCEGYEQGEVVHSRFKVIGDIEDYDVLRDVKTGCVYLESEYDYTLTPLYDENGKVEGCGEKNIDLGKYE